MLVDLHSEVSYISDWRDSVVSNRDNTADILIYMVLWHVDDHIGLLLLLLLLLHDTPSILKIWCRRLI